MLENTTALLSFLILATNGNLNRVGQNGRRDHRTNGNENEHDQMLILPADKNQ